MWELRSLKKKRLACSTFYITMSCLVLLTPQSYLRRSQQQVMQKIHHLLDVTARIRNAGCRQSLACRLVLPKLERYSAILYDKINNYSKIVFSSSSDDVGIEFGMIYCGKCMTFEHRTLLISSRKKKCS